MLFLTLELNYFCRDVFAALYLHNLFCVLIKESKGFYQGKLVRQDHLKMSTEKYIFCWTLLLWNSCCWKRTVDKKTFFFQVFVLIVMEDMETGESQKKRVSVHKKKVVRFQLSIIYMFEWVWPGWECMSLCILLQENQYTIYFLCVGDGNSWLIQKTYHTVQGQHQWISSCITDAGISHRPLAKSSTVGNIIPNW